MAGVVPKKSTSGRKQWTLHDGSRSSLKRLRSQMATDGCPESQVVLAKQLLDENNETDRETIKENERLGVYWLIKASEQGNTEATNLLKQCLDTGKGINELNYLDVKSCISMSQQEKLARKAAREMFASLSNGGDYITSDQLQRRILAIDRDQEKPDEVYANGTVNGELMYAEVDSEEETDWSQKSDTNNEKLTEDRLVSAAVDYSHGHLPLVNKALCLSPPDLRALDHISFVQRPILHPVLALKILYFKLIKFLGSQFTEFFPLAKSELQLLGLIFVYMLVSTENIVAFFPMTLYYLTFVTMIITTFKTLQVKREFHDFRLWSGLFICYSNGDLEPDMMEYQYLCNNLKPYFWFFGALFINLLIYPVIVEQWVPQSELMIVSFTLTFVTLLSYLNTKRGRTIFDWLVFFSFGVNVLAKYPYETDPVVAQGWRFLDLKIPTFASYVIGNGIEFCINFRLLLYLCIPILLVKIASRQNWKGTYQTLIPHCVTLSWLQICIISSQGTTTFGLLRGSLVLVGVVLFLPLVGLASIMLPAAALTKYIATSSVTVTSATFTVIATTFLGICWFFAQTRYKKIAAFIQILCTCLTIILLAKSNYSNDTHYYNSESKLPEFLSWDVYQRFCYQPVWQDENVALAQIKCAHLQHSNIHWDGYITDIKVKSISNKYQTLFDYLPQRWQQELYCVFGEYTKNDCSTFPELVRDECNSFYEAMKSTQPCSLEKHNKYTFEITTRMQAGLWGKNPEVTIIANNVFKNFTLALKPNDHIWFKGTLFNNEIDGADSILGGYRTHVSLEEVGCLACANNKLTNAKKTIQTRFDPINIKDSLIMGIKFILNVILSPVVVFK